MKYRILSWDVGIKNLAGCIIEYNSENTEKPFDIEWWDIIDLVKIEEKYCNQYDKKKNKCSNKAKYKCRFLEDVYYYCGTHKKCHTNITNIPIETIKPIDKNTICYKCGTIAKFYLNNNQQCYNLCTKDKNTLLKESKLLELKPEKIKNINIDKIKYNLWIEMDLLPQLLNVDEVIIENQPTLKNPKMKSVAETLYNYYLCRGIIDKIDNNSSIERVKYISPSNKLKLNNDNTISILSKSTSSSETYKLTKQLSIKYVYQFIKDKPNLIKHLDSFKKKDDLCDCFLQGLYYIMKQLQLCNKK